MLKLIFGFILTFSLTNPQQVWAQENSNSDIVESTKNDLMIVAGAGVGGAVLGLSTLSFYDKPSKHISNIWMGAAIGIIAGVVYVAFNYAQKSQYEAFNMPSSKDLDTYSRQNWHDESLQAFNFQSSLQATPIWGRSF